MFCIVFLWNWPHLHTSLFNATVRIKHHLSLFPLPLLSLRPPLPLSTSPFFLLSLHPHPPLPPSSSLSILFPSPSILLSPIPPLFPYCSPPSFSPASHTHLHHSATRSLIFHLHSQQCQWAAGHGWEGARSRCKRHRGNNNCMFIHPWRVKAYITTWEDSVSADR